MTLRQPILYAEMMWRNQRLWVLLLVVAGVVVTPAMLIVNKGRFDSSIGVFLLYLPLGLLYGAAMLFYRQRSSAEVTDAGLRVSKLTRSALIGYDLIRSIRVQMLELHFQERRRRMIRPLNRPLMSQDALFLRLRADDPRVAEIGRLLGGQLFAVDTVALPVPDPNALASEVTARLPERTGVNLGGRRRRKRPR